MQEPQAGTALSLHLIVADTQCVPFQGRNLWWSGTVLFLGAVFQALVVEAAHLPRVAVDPELRPQVQGWLFVGLLTEAQRWDQRSCTCVGRPGREAGAGQAWVAVIHRQQRWPGQVQWSLWNTLKACSLWSWRLSLFNRKETTFQKIFFPSFLPSTCWLLLWLLAWIKHAYPN